MASDSARNAQVLPARETTDGAGIVIINRISPLPQVSAAPGYALMWDY